MKFFASDNNSGVHPRIFQAMAEAGAGDAPAYGDDRWTEAAREAVRREFGPEARVWFVFLGTAANVLALKSMVRSHEAVLCAETAHINTDECGAPEALIGCKLLPVAGQDGKICLEACERLLGLRDSVHFSYPRALAVTQATECGTVYTLEELRAISAFCRKHGLYLYMDGARLANAAAALGVSLGEMTAGTGVDVVSLGGTKNGLMYGEAVVFLNPELGAEFPYLCKQHMQLGSKMRFIGAQFSAYLDQGLWRENAAQANRMAALLSREMAAMDHVRLAHPVEANAVFARMHKDTVSRLNGDFYFYTLDQFDGAGYPKDWHLVRFMTSCNTSEEDVLEFAAALRACGRPS